MIEKLFSTKEEYEAAHNLKNMKDMNYIDDKESVELYIRDEIEYFVRNENITIKEMQLNDFFIEKIGGSIKEKYGLSVRKTADFLGISKEKIIKILKETE